MPPARRKAVVGQNDMMAILAERLKKQAKLPDINGYVPHVKQQNFHRSPAKKRLYIGGNRSGKTTAGVAEDIFYLKGQHPFKRVPEAPVAGRVIGVDFLRGVESILIPQFKRWLPPSLLINGSWDRSYSNATKTLTLSNGSFLEFMSYEQETDKFAGVPRHFIHYDEEPPYHIYDECQARLIDYNGDAWFTMTPVEGMTWVYDTLYLPGIEAKNNILVVEADMMDNPYISQEGRDNFLLGLDKDTREARQRGQFVQLGGLVFKNFDVEKHVIPQMVPPKEWEWYSSADFGWNNPTAWLWHAVSPEGNVITFAEQYENERTAGEHAAMWHARNEGFGRIPDIVVGDPAGQQRSQATGTSIITEYSEHGVYITPGNNDVLIGVNQMQQYLGNSPERPNVNWQITENCVHLIRETQRLRWKTYAGRKAKFENNPYEQIHKKDDHAPDSARYFFTCLPELKPEIRAKEVKQPLVSTSFLRYDEAVAGVVQTDWRINEGTNTYALEYD